MIAETYRLAATDTDVLAAPSRLSSLPYDGVLVIEMQATVNDGTNQFAVTLQLPDGSTPLDNVIIPDGAIDGALNDNDKYTIAVPASAGGHVLLSAVETGTAVLMIRCTLTP